MRPTQRGLLKVCINQPRAFEMRPYEERLFKVRTLQAGAFEAR
jgi:hypothetical protein